MGLFKGMSEVTVPGQGPYTTTIRQAIPRMQAPMLQPGTPLPVKVDPADRGVSAAPRCGYSSRATMCASGTASPWRVSG